MTSMMGWHFAKYDFIIAFLPGLRNGKVDALTKDQEISLTSRMNAHNQSKYQSWAKNFNQN